MTTQPYQVRLRAILTRAAAELGIPDGYAPSSNRYDPWAKANGYPSAGKLTYRAFPSTWSRVVESAGLRPLRDCPRTHSRRKGHAVPVMTLAQQKRAIVEDLRRVAKLIGRPDHIPSPLAYRKHGRFVERVVRDRLSEGSWHDVAAAANLMPNRWRNGYWTRERAINAYRDAARRLGRKRGGPGLTASEVRQFLTSPKTLQPYVGGVNQLAVLAGYQPRPSGANVRYERKAAA